MVRELAKPCCQSKNFYKFNIKERAMFKYSKAQEFADSRNCGGIQIVFTSLEMRTNYIDIKRKLGDLARTLDRIQGGDAQKIKDKVTSDLTRMREARLPDVNPGHCLLGVKGKEIFIQSLLACSKALDINKIFTVENFNKVLNYDELLICKAIAMQESGAFEESGAPGYKDVVYSISAPIEDAQSAFDRMIQEQRDKAQRYIASLSATSSSSAEPSSPLSASSSLASRTTSVISAASSPAQPSSSSSSSSSSMVLAAAMGFGLSTAPVASSMNAMPLSSSLVPSTSSDGLVVLSALSESSYHPLSSRRR